MATSSRILHYARGAIALMSFFALVANAMEIKSAPTKPNILLIVLDDAGYGDISGFGNSTAPTPTLKQLGDDGVRFTRFYADATCGPARLSLLTGKQTSRVAMVPDFYGISPEVETLPEKLKQAGYTTHHIGKWHAGDGTRLAWPSAQGFDYWFGFLNQFALRGPDKDGKFVPHRPTYINPWLQRDDGHPQRYQGHLETILADAAVKKIQELKNSRSPWFINYWIFAPHNPATASDEYLKKFPDTPAGKYQALLKQMDDEIGRVLKVLDETGQANNTLVVVLSDNGGTNERDANNGPFEGEKAQLSEGGTRTPMIIRWPHDLSSMLNNKNKNRATPDYAGVTAIYDLYPTLLSAAGVDVAADLDGVNLFPLVKEQLPRPPQTLFWEAGGDYNYSYSVLSSDGRWRLDDERLYDLQLDPFARKNIFETRADKAKELKQLFLDWRKRVHYLALATEVFQAEKFLAYKITGDSFRRSPGYGGFTFVSSMTPVNEQPLTGTIAEQKGMWSMVMTADQRIQIRMNEQEFVTKPLRLDACTPLVFSSYYYRSKLQPNQNHGVWFLSVGKQEVLLEKRLKPADFPDNFAEPTWVGRDATNGHPFTGKLESPQFYNEFYSPNDPWNAGRDAQWLAETVCQKTAR